ncbi:putative integral membrane protein [Rhizobium leguminosarum bv. trifolii WSM2297]|uniref:Putative integral membrane protein n=1 Tax=Rhizobium leguminosarum bv. trifolii WSM2297 TaxID=754762 RepID=J0CG15_RHILT|nr:anthrone oxygenase family protein [Rhizobium leguminosarum]EJC82367.1 putative integral membrane protein [Rhizobium leguminosarum bv. trifolii WSM2297]
MQIVLILSLVAAAIGSGLVAGIFFAFSTFIMTAFSRIPAEQGIAAMNSINVTIVRSPFMALFVPTAILCLVITVLALMNWRGGASALMLAGAALYVFASFLSTIIFNVPMNDALEKVSGGGAEAAQLWATYLRDWTWWNHVRTIASLLASVAFVRALMVI